MTILFRSSTGTQQGVTLLELVIVLVIMGIVAAIAAPSFRGMMDRSHLRGSATDLIEAIRTGRADAVSYRGAVRLRQVDSAWSNGWELDYSVGNTGQQNRVFAPHQGVTVTTKGNVNEMRFRPNGTVNQSMTFVLCNNKNGRQIEVSLVGRVTNTEVTCP